jgi:ABC-type multidrug transport system ATPase subunit
MATMKISLSDLGKRYNREWIFRHLEYEFDQQHRYAITGSNGSGKSTLMQVLAGLIHHSEGIITHQKNNQIFSPEKIFHLISFSAPYIDVPDELSFRELLSFHFQFKTIRDNISTDAIIDYSGLKKSADKQIRHFSSGMKQRVRLSLSFFANTPLLFLDEPCINLDAAGIQWYKQLLESTTKDRLLIISSNDKHEYDSCDRILSMEDFKNFR